MRINVSRGGAPEHGKWSSGMWTEGRPPWFRAPVPVGLVEIVAEEVGDRTWTGALVDRFVPYGDVYFRFVARERVPGLRPRRALVVLPLHGTVGVLASPPRSRATRPADRPDATSAWVLC